jgi:hypothetical protein
MWSLRQACGKALVAQQHPSVKQNVSGCKNIASIVSLKIDKVGNISNWRVSSSSTGRSKCIYFVTGTCKAFESGDMPLFKINNH